MGGEQLVVEAGTVPQQILCTSDHRFTMLPFTSATGEPVCCVIILQSATGEVPPLWQHGHDKMIELIRDAKGKVDAEANMGKGESISVWADVHIQWKKITLPCLWIATWRHDWCDPGQCVD